MPAVSTLLDWLKAAADATRLRLLALCAQREFSVSDLAEVLGQSEPRVSRHLKLLCEAGLLERTRQGQWVHYQLTRDEGGASFVRALLAQLDRGDRTLVEDREAAQLTRAETSVAAARESRLGRTLEAFVASTRPRAPAARVLLQGVEHLELLEVAASLGGECMAVARSRRAAQAARGFGAQRGLTCRVLTPENTAASFEASPAQDALLLDRTTAADGTLVAALEAARRRLAPGGRLWLFERYDALENAREAHRGGVVEHPLASLRRLLGDAGFHCERLVPLEADGVHVLAAAATSAASAALSRTGS